MRFSDEEMEGLDDLLADDHMSSTVSDPQPLAQMKPKRRSRGGEETGVDLCVKCDIYDTHFDCSLYQCKYSKPHSTSSSYYFKKAVKSGTV